MTCCTVEIFQILQQVGNIVWSEEMKQMNLSYSYKMLLNLKSGFCPFQSDCDPFKYVFSPARVVVFPVCGWAFQTKIKLQHWDTKDVTKIITHLVIVIWKFLYPGMKEASLVSDCLPLPPTPTSMALPRGVRIIRDIRIRWIIASLKNTISMAAPRTCYQ